MSSSAKACQGGGAASTVGDRDGHGIQDDKIHMEAGPQACELVEEHEERVICNKSEARAAEGVVHDYDAMRHVISNALAAIAATDNDEADDDESASLESTSRGFSGMDQWKGFCSRVESGEATPSCVIDFPYADNCDRGLKLVGDERLLERMYCFHDPQYGQRDQKLVVVHAHTLMTWGERSAARDPVFIDEFTSVSARHAIKENGVFKEERQETGDGGKKKPIWYVVPHSKELVYGWRKLFNGGEKSSLIWNLGEQWSMPSEDDPNFSYKYETLRPVLVQGESLCENWKDNCEIVKTIRKKEECMRGGQAAEYRVAGVSLPRATCLTSLERKQHVEVFPTCAPAPPPQKPFILFNGINVNWKDEMAVHKECS
jgi:hypothetical protein